MMVRTFLVDQVFRLRYTLAYRDCQSCTGEVKEHVLFSSHDLPWSAIHGLRNFKEATVLIGKIPIY